MNQTQVHAPHPVVQQLQRHVRAIITVEPSQCARFALNLAGTSAPQAQAPLCVVAPATETDAYLAHNIVRTAGLALAVAGQSTAVSTPKPFVTLDTQHTLNRMMHLDPHRGSAVVQPGVSLAQLNAAAMVHGLCFPVGRMSANMQHTTLGQMVAHNRCDAHVALYGSTVHHQLGVDVVLADGTECFLGSFGLQAPAIEHAAVRQLVSRLFELAARNEHALREYYPKAHYCAQGFMVDVFYPQNLRPYTADGSVNLGHLLAGSCASLAYIKRIHLKLTPLAQFAHTQAPHPVIATAPLAPALFTLCQDLKRLFDPKALFV